MWLIYLIRYFARMTNYEEGCEVVCSDNGTHAIRVRSFSATAVKSMDNIEKDKQCLNIKHTLLKSSASLPSRDQFYRLISRLKFTSCLSYQRPHFLSSRTRVVAPKVPSGAAAHLGGREAAQQVRK